MKTYDKTLWENNKTIVDADKLNNIEDQIQVLTLTTAESNGRIQTLEDTMPMKANVSHTHSEYALTEDLSTLREDLGTIRQDIDVLRDNSDGLRTDLGLLTEDLGSLTEDLIVLREDLDRELKKYFDNVELEENVLKFYSNNVLIKSITLPEFSSPRAKAICGEFLCNEALCGEGLDKTKSKSYTPTIWKDGVTPVNAENLNNIENKILELIELVEGITSEGTSEGTKEIHIGNEAPTDTNLLWIDNEDEEPELSLDESVIEAFSAVLQNHSEQLKELFYLSDAYLDDGEFTDNEESDYILEGGIF